MGIKETLLSFMKEEAYRPMDIQELVSVFDISSDEYKVFKKTLKIMELEGSIVRTNKDKFAVPERLGLIKGRIQSHKKGFGFLIPEEDGERDVFIPSSFINGAMNNDRVLVQITRDDVNGKKREGEVIEILERANTKIIGVYEDSRNFGFVVPEDTRLNQDIFISKKDKNGANHGDIVIAEVTKWPDKRRSPEGVIKEVLGKKGEKGLDILTIIKKHGLPEEFPAKVLAYAEGIPEEIDEKEIKRRKDIRNIRMVTIDGEDAKDLDDAVSIEKLENGKYKLGVHIADVSHYVKEKNPLDKEALKRATSVYLIDRVIPMLPKKLSNGICSLNPKVDRLALSCFMTIDNILNSGGTGKRQTVYAKTLGKLRKKYEISERRQGVQHITSVRGIVKPAFQMSYEEDILIRSTFNCKMSDVAQNDSTKRIALSPKQQKL